MAQILVFGDSITYGRGDCEHEGWVGRIKFFFNGKILELEKYLFIYNLGVSADTTKNLIERFEFETKQRLSKRRKNITIFGIGINDSCYSDDKKTLDVSSEQFKKNLKRLIDLARKFSSNIIFIGLTPVDESRTTPISWNANKFYKNQYIKEYNQIIRSVCEESDVYFIEILDEFKKVDYKKLLEDGVHPNSEGHQKIFEIVKNFLEEKKII
jgi:lysophospholipase L1-like esterase